VAISDAEAIDRLSFPAATTAEVVDRRPAIEDEVVGLFDELRNPVLRYVLSFGLPVHDGEEVTQEVFLALLRHLQARKSRRSLRGWIFRVAHNLALKRRQANRRSPASAESHWGMAEQQPDRSPSPEDRAWSLERRRRLLAVFHALPEDDRCCLRLRSEGLRYREIAEVLGISLGSVSMSLARSIARLIRADEA
jgi:RNA polymerase sigma-70 factor (ECF subfamily)